MNIKIQGAQMEVSEAMETYVTRKLQSLEKLVDENSLFEVELGKISKHHRSGDVYKAEFNVRSHGDYSRVCVEGEDVYAAVDKARDELDNILSSKKDKKHTLWKKGSMRIKEFIHGIAKKKRK
jgi:ribosomal subunit interface protein